MQQYFNTPVCPHVLLSCACPRQRRLAFFTGFPNVLPSCTGHFQSLLGLLFYKIFSACNKLNCCGEWFWHFAVGSIGYDYQSAAHVLSCFNLDLVCCSLDVIYWSILPFFYSGLNKIWHFILQVVHVARLCKDRHQVHLSWIWDCEIC
jgi:hypothetical protein